jgi:large subunit ribosomal protein L22
MSKPKTLRALPANTAKAEVGMLTTTPRKLNLVAQLIRGMHVSDALDTLAFSKKRAAKEVRKLLSSAISNAENNHGLDVDSLIVSEAFVGKAMMLKRMMPRARGRGARILKRYSRMTVIVREVEVA